MKKIKKKTVLLVFSTFSIMFGGTVFLVTHRNREVDLSITSPALFYSLKESDIPLLEKKALGNDCDASFKLSTYHANVTLQLRDALMWGRIAAKCREIKPKEHLLSLLRQMRDDPDVVKEIDVLIEQVRDIDPREAIRMRESFVSQYPNATPSLVK